MNNNNNNMSDVFSNFSKMMNGQEVPDNIKNILEYMSQNSSAGTGTNNSTSNADANATHDSTDWNKSNSENCWSQNTNQSNNSNSNNIFGNIDMETILKMQKIMSSMNNSQADSRTNLLMSLKPYLKESRKSKVDQYVQLMKMSKIFEIMNPLGGDSKHV